jgi:predicted metal-binding protein
LRLPAEIVACETCGGSAQRDPAGRTRGENLLLQLRIALASAGALPVQVSSVRCLWACKRSCAVAVRSTSRVGYVIADLEPTELTAQALLDYATRYAHSEDGAVPFREWPALLKGHFLCRFPKAAELPTDDPSADLGPQFPDADQAPQNPDERARSKDEQLP